MKIEITDRFRAFSHSPGHEAMIPASHSKAKVCPASLEVTCSLSGEKQTLFWDIKGPVLPFTVEQDLEKACLRIYGESSKGYFRFVLKKEEGFIVLYIEKTPLEGISLLEASGAVKNTYHSGEKIVLIADKSSYESAPVEQLFLGNSKHKDWDLIRKRRDLTEILPFWYALGQMTPSLPKEEGPVMDLLTMAEEMVRAEDRSIDKTILNLYLAGFSGGLVPRAFDPEFQGILPISSSVFTSAETLLKRGSLLIRSLFFQEHEGVYHIFPCLPSQFVCGKMIGIMTNNGSKINLEWTKHKMRRMTVSVETEGNFQAIFSSEIKEFRLKVSFKDKGRIFQNGAIIPVTSGQRLWIDRFQK